ncbi:MAG: heavy-metal-associated domain-containing protein [Gemmatimonadetes bacterium]|nr:heavy-metal-associated domain-containing protein [Gemmatimonadota bacterium]
MQVVRMEITGMSCGHCVAAVSRALEAVDGVSNARVELGAATVSYDGDRALLRQLEQAVVDEGYVVVATR